jgi:hypothetical protein
MSYHNGPRIVTDGLIVCLDAAHSRSYPGSGSSWFDLSGNNYTFNIGGGTYSGANKSIAYNGAYTNGYESITNSVPFSNNWTISVFGKPTNTIDSLSNCASGSMTVFSKEDGGTGFGLSYVYYSAVNYRLSATIAINPSSPNFIYINKVITGTEFEIINRVHLYTLRCSYNAATNTTTGTSFMNGIQLQTGSITNGGPPISPLGQFRIGGRSNNCSNGSFKGNLYSVYVHNRALSNSEILQNYNALKGRFQV